MPTRNDYSRVWQCLLGMIIAGSGQCLLGMIIAGSGSAY